MFIGKKDLFLHFCFKVRENHNTCAKLYTKDICCIYSHLAYVCNNIEFSIIPSFYQSTLPLVSGVYEYELS